MKGDEAWSNPRRSDHIRLIQSYILGLGCSSKRGKFWCGRTDTEYPMCQYEEIVGHPPSEDIKAAMRHLRRHIAILEARHDWA